MPALTQRQRKLGPRDLVALAHPLRIRLRNELRRFGPATATQLAKRFGESSGATSYHLRMLARHGFIEADAGRGTGRQRWWRAAPEVLIVDADPTGDDVTREAVRILTSEVRREADENRRRWFAEADRWSDPWRKASSDGVYLGRLNAAQAAEFRDRLDEVITHYIGLEPGEGDRTIEVHLDLFPLGDPE